MSIVPNTPQSWESVGRALSSGQLVVVPTDTVYGLVCDPFNVAAIESVYEMKGRPTNKALPLLISGPEVLAFIAREIPQSARALAEAFWPGALTLVVVRNANLPPELTGSDTVAVRMPGHDGLLRFLDAYGGFLAGTSANLSGQPDARTAAEAYGYFGERVALILDGGSSHGGTPSTLVDCTTTPPRVLRQGGIGEQEILAVIRRAEARA